MRNLLASVVLNVAVACVVLLPLAGCLNSAQIEALKPRNARSAYAEAETLFTGVIATTEALAQHGLLNREQLGTLFDAFTKVGETLDRARALLDLGNAVEALAQINLAHVDLVRLADALTSVRAAPAPAPASYHPRSESI